MLPDRVWWTALAAERSLRRAREWSARRADPRPVATLPLRSPAGHALPCRLHLPAGEGPFPGVFLCPGGLDGVRGGEGLSPVLTAPRLARAGYAALTFGPSGREGVPGPEDRNGPLHQEEAAAALALLRAHPAVDPHRLAAFSISFGIVLAMGALARHPADAVRGLIDWEGPPSRRWFVSRRLGYRTDDEAWWAPREAVRLLPRLRCPYWRFQSVWDHVHGAEHGLGEELVDAALAAGVPEVRFNGWAATDPRRYGPFWVGAQGRRLEAWIAELVA